MSFFLNAFWFLDAINIKMTCVTSYWLRLFGSEREELWLFAILHYLVGYEGEETRGRQPEPKSDITEIQLKEKKEKKD